MAVYELDDSYLQLQAMDSNINSKALRAASGAGIDYEIIDKVNDSCRKKIMLLINP